MREIKKTAILALAASVPITAMCWYFTWALVHSQDAAKHIASVLLTPILSVIHIWDRLGFNDSPYVFLPALLIAQFAGYFPIIYFIRLLARKVRGARA